jgi:hypothetical protein
MSTKNSRGRWRFRTWSAPLLVLWIGMSVIGCDSLIDVENPNNVLAEDFEAPVASNAVVNGALYEVQAGFAGELGPYSIVGDEIEWSGSRDAWQELMFGQASNPFNEFTDLFYDDMSVGRWMVDKAITTLENHDANGDLLDRNDLARAYLFSGIMYVIIADWFDDFVFSDLRDAAPAIGPSNMGSLYTTALERINKGLAIKSDGDLGRNLMAMRARTKHAQSVWGMIGDNSTLTYATSPTVTHPSGTAHNIIVVPNTGLVSNQGAADDAAAALAMQAGDWRYDFEFTGGTQSSQFGEWQFDRQENRISDDYGVPAADNVSVTDISLMDPIAGIPDPRMVQWVLVELQPNNQFLNHVQLSARGMHLIIAEHALAQAPADMPTFTTHINMVRGFGGVAGVWDGSAGQPSARDMLIHERRVNLFLQGRRVNDMFRFGLASNRWNVSFENFSTPGNFLPITIREIRANCHLNPDFECSS